MKVLVTGGAGYIGSVAVRWLLDEGCEVAVFDNLERGHMAAVDARSLFIKGDLRDLDSTREAVRTFRPDAVMHFVAYALVEESMAGPEVYFRNNVVGGINLAEAMLESGVRRIVFSSSCATYGQPRQVPITEDAPQEPANPYGESKLALEKCLFWYARVHGFQTVVLRYFNACGATEQHGEDHEPETHLIPVLMQAALGQRKEVKIYGDDYDTPDGTCIRDFVHVCDLARAHYLALKFEGSDAFNLGIGRGYSVREVVETAREVTGHEIPVVIGPRRPGDPPRLVAAVEKARKILKWEPRYTDLRGMIETAWQWHRSHPRGYEDRNGAGS
ncbi:MAG: UDP-glucose 4-epimerase GalE [Kiritimatiellae bacterium]|nr:UDP-glucose 4-epimerase GalE [Kiritimatiellia bacterium]